MMMQFDQWFDEKHLGVQVCYDFGELKIEISQSTTIHFIITTLFSKIFAQSL